MEIINDYINVLKWILFLSKLVLLPAWPEVRGTADADGGAYSPFRSIILVLTHDFIIIQLYGPAGGDGQDGLNDADAGLRTILDAV